MRSKTTDKLLFELQKNTKPYTQKVKDIELLISPSIYPPRFDTILLSEQIYVNQKSKVLDVGTGSGFLSIIAAKQDAEVIGVDINPMAIEYAIKNVSNNGLKEKIEIRSGFIFESIKTEEKFDLILANLPFENAFPKTLLEYSVYDPGFSGLKTFFSHASNYLKKDGFILFSYADYGDMNFLKRITSNYHMELIKESLNDGEMNYVFKFTPIFT